MKTPQDMFRFGSTIGFENLFDSLMSESRYPPYNIRKEGEDRFVIEMGLSGFGRQDLDIELNGDKLIIKGNAPVLPGGEYLHRGLATRAFEKSFALAKEVVVRDAAMINGVLRIALERIVADQAKVKKINISEPTGQQYLTEDRL